MPDVERNERRLRRDISFEAVKEADFIFDMFDIDNDGQLSEKEFRNGMWTLTGQDDWDDISHIFEQVSTSMAMVEKKYLKYALACPVI
jgi:Ca2+-binding EF-hand superfamily protein